MTITFMHHADDTLPSRMLCQQCRRATRDTDAWICHVFAARPVGESAAPTQCRMTQSVRREQGAATECSEHDDLPYANNSYPCRTNMMAISQYY